MKTQEGLKGLKPEIITNINKRVLAYVARGLAVMLTLNSLHVPTSIPALVFGGGKKETEVHKKLYKALNQVYYHNLAIFLKLIYKAVRLYAPNATTPFDENMLQGDLKAALKYYAGRFIGKKGSQRVLPCFTNTPGHILPNEFVALLPLHIGKLWNSEDGNIDELIHGSSNFDQNYIRDEDEGCDFATTAVDLIRQLVHESGLDKVGYPINSKGDELVKKLPRPQQN